MAEPSFDTGLGQTLHALASKGMMRHIADTRISRTPIYAAPTTKTGIDFLGLPPGMNGYYSPAGLGQSMIALNTDSVPQSLRSDDPLGDYNRWQGPVIAHEQWHALQHQNSNVSRTAQTKSDPNYQLIHDALTQNSPYAPKEMDVELPAFLTSNSLEPTGYVPTIANQLLKLPTSAGKAMTTQQGYSLAPDIIARAKSALMKLLNPQELRAVRP